MNKEKNLKNDMTIRRRIFLSNTVMVFLALLMLLGVGGFLIDTFRDEFLTDYGAVSELSGYTDNVKEILQQDTAYGTDWEKWSTELSKYNFRLYVKNSDDEAIYKNVHHNESEVSEGISSDSVSEGAVRYFYMEGTTVLTTRLTADGQEYLLIASSSNGSFNFLGMDRGLFEMFLIVFLITGLITIGILLFLSQFVTNRMIRKILQPVQDLDDATKRMQEGNLSQPIAYDRQDEFKPVCDSFDQMQTVLRQNMEQKDRYEKARTEMVSGISHDLRTPLTSVKGYIKGMLDGVADTEEKRQKYLEIAYRKSCDMDRLLSRLFYFSRLETGNMPLYKKNTEMKQFLMKYVAQKQQEYEGRIQFKNYYSDLPDETVCNIDAEQFIRIFDNLIENSLKYAEADALQIFFAGRVISEDKAQMLQIRIQDNGKGLPQDKLEHVFEQFYRADDARNSKKEGNGLGLYICRYIVEAHGGHIEAENDRGFGIIITIPIAEKGN